MTPITTNRRAKQVIRLNMSLTLYSLLLRLSFVLLLYFHNWNKAVFSCDMYRPSHNEDR